MSAPDEAQLEVVVAPAAANTASPGSATAPELAAATVPAVGRRIARGQARCALTSRRGVAIRYTLTPLTVIEGSETALMPPGPFLHWYEEES
jgi:hypothetical protein